MIKRYCELAWNRNYEMTDTHAIVITPTYARRGGSASPCHGNLPKTWAERRAKEGKDCADLSY